ncbi:hypothetical protein BTM25_47290 [Actinomadura rubteroloni]|uniref:Uncharacterized protein n=1 Tax=Actinomadura rubteroloni TaxID=1926885 RepID=A0A2P4UES8_9ACTN|nr:hypothetical protein [Actinomadura rubteroloni]POM23574.1 hypothetical protein BTM25_47290 [Actinomadura rubteroloni]
MARRTIFDEALRGVGRTSKGTNKALRSGMRVGKRKSGKKRIKRNERQIERLSEQIENLTRQVSLLTQFQSNDGVRQGQRAE